MSRVLLISGGLPHTLHGGGGITAFAIMSGLLNRGADVTVAGLRGKFESAYDTEAEERLRKLGVQVRWIVESPRERFLQVSHPIGHIAGAAYASGVSELVAAMRPDALVCYHWEALAVAYPLEKSFALCGFVGDPVHLPFMYRRGLLERYEPGTLKKGFVPWLRRQLMLRAMVAEQERLLNRCDSCGAFAAHHAAWFRGQGIRNCEYVRTPVPDPCPDGQCTAMSKAGSQKLVLLLLGHLAGTATLAGLDDFAVSTLPVLRRTLGDDGFEVRIVGGMRERAPASLMAKLECPPVRFLGQVNPPDEPFAESHMLVVPTPVELGIRVRILTGFSYGACVVAHEANLRGIPELTHNGNCRLAANGVAVAEEIIDLWRRPDERRRLAEAGRQTYEQYFSMEQAGDAIAGRIEGTIATARG